jgi:hypothetical protein
LRRVANRTARFLKARGYKYTFFPSAWWSATEHSNFADVEFDAYPEFDLSAELRRSELRVALLDWSPLGRVMERSRAEPAHYLNSFAGLRDVARDPAPTFTFAHVTLPHIPYIFDAGCGVLRAPIVEENDSPAQRSAYLAQTQCVDSLVLDLVTGLVEQSSPTPIILLLGDHGSRFTDYTYSLHPERVRPAFIAERFGAFAAFLLPDGGSAELDEPLTLVNSMGGVLRYYFGAQLPTLPDAMYVSGSRPYRFYPVSPAPEPQALAEVARSSSSAAPLRPALPAIRRVSYEQGVTLTKPN